MCYSLGSIVHASLANSTLFLLKVQANPLLLSHVDMLVAIAVVDMAVDLYTVPAEHFPDIQ